MSKEVAVVDWKEVLGPSYGLWQKHLEGIGAVKMSSERDEILKGLKVVGERDDRFDPRTRAKYLHELDGWVKRQLRESKQFEAEYGKAYQDLAQKKKVSGGSDQFTPVSTDVILSEGLGIELPKNLSGIAVMPNFGTGQAIADSSRMGGMVVDASGEQQRMTAKEATEAVMGKAHSRSEATVVRRHKPVNWPIVGEVATGLAALGLSIFGASRLLRREPVSSLPPRTPVPTEGGGAVPGAGATAGATEQQKPTSTATAETAQPTDQPTAVVTAIDPNVEVLQGHGENVYSHELGPDGSGRGIRVNFDSTGYPIPQGNPDGPIFSGGVLYDLLANAAKLPNAQAYLDACKAGSPQLLVDLPNFGATRGPVKVDLCNPTFEFVKKPVGSVPSLVADGWRVSSTYAALRAGNGEPEYMMKVIDVDGLPFVLIGWNPLVIQSREAWGSHPGSLSANLGRSLLTGGLLLQDVVLNNGDYTDSREILKDSSNIATIQPNGLKLDFAALYSSPSSSGKWLSLEKHDLMITDPTWGGMRTP